MFQKMLQVGSGSGMEIKTKKITYTTGGSSRINLSLPIKENAVLATECTDGTMSFPTIVNGEWYAQVLGFTYASNPEHYAYSGIFNESKEVTAYYVEIKK